MTFLTCITARSMMARVAEMLQISDLLDRRPRQLSGGQRQRVAMGRALARDPELFLFDEPLSNLDAQLRLEMRAEIKMMHRRLGKTICYVTHDQIEAMTLGDRIRPNANASLHQQECGSGPSSRTDNGCDAQLVKVSGASRRGSC
jgi:ABC-type sugar transport system ATPase subunit